MKPFNMIKTIGAVALLATASQATAYPAAFENAGPQKRLLAVRAAQVDAQRLLLEKIYGLQLDARTTIRDLAAVNDRIQVSAEGSIQGVTYPGEPVYHASGRVEVTGHVKLRQLIETITTEVKNRRIGSLKLKPKSTEVIERRYREAELTATGMGALPGSKGQQQALARRAAQADAYRQLTERLMGVQVTSDTTVQDLITADDRVRTHVSNIVRGAVEVSHRFSPDGTCEVVMEIKEAEVVERIRYLAGVQQGETETIQRTNVYRVTGVGAPRAVVDQNPAGTAGSGTGTGTVIIERVIDDGILLDR